jgi:preprotein translocase subunit SecB
VKKDYPMAEPENAAQNGEPLTNGEDTSPVAGLISQYVKDMSFENPGAPAVFQSQGQPQFTVEFAIGKSQLGDDLHEVVLKIEVRAQIENQNVFLVDVAYAGLFAMRNVPVEQLDPFLLAEGPRVLFPFARRIVADAVRDGGYSFPLLLEPIDFHGLYLQRAAEQGEGAPAEASQA